MKLDDVIIKVEADETINPENVNLLRLKSEFVIVAELEIACMNTTLELSEDLV